MNWFVIMESESLQIPLPPIVGNPCQNRTDAAEFKAQPSAIKCKGQLHFNWCPSTESNRVLGLTRSDIIHKCFKGVVWCCHLESNQVLRLTRPLHRHLCFDSFLFGTDHRSRTCMGFPPLRSKRSVYTIPPDRHYVWRRGRGSNSPKTDRQSVALPECYHGNVWGL